MRSGFKGTISDRRRGLEADSVPANTVGRVSIRVDTRSIGRILAQVAHVDGADRDVGDEVVRRQQRAHGGDREEGEEHEAAARKGALQERGDKERQQQCRLEPDAPPLPPASMVVGYLIGATHMHAQAWHLCQHNCVHNSSVSLLLCACACMLVTHWYCLAHSS